MLGTTVGAISSGELEIEEISLQGATVDTRDFIQGMAVKGHLGELFLESHGVMFSPETARINEFYVKNTDIALTLEELPEDDVPLAEVPKTGDASILWFALSALSGAGLVGLNLTKKREDEE